MIKSFPWIYSGLLNDFPFFYLFNSHQSYERCHRDIVSVSECNYFGIRKHFLWFRKMLPVPYFVISNQWQLSPKVLGCRFLLFVPHKKNVYPEQKHPLLDTFIYEEAKNMYELDRYSQLLVILPLALKWLTFTYLF